MATTDRWPELEAGSAQPRSGMDDLTKAENEGAPESSAGSRDVAKPHLTNGLKGWGKRAVDEPPHPGGLRSLAWKVVKSNDPHGTVML